MPKKESTTLTTTIELSDDGLHRYLLQKQWDTSKRRAMVLMLFPSSADGINVDNTTMYVINNLSRLDFGTVNIVNLYSKINASLKNNKTFEGLTDSHNDKAIAKAAQESDTVIVAWGKAGENNKKICQREKEVCKLLQPYKNKLFELHGTHGEQGFHPLHPALRFSWRLEPLELPVFPEEEPEATPPKKDKKGKRAKEPDKGKAEEKPEEKTEEIEAETA